ncbi:MAG TPA: AMP-binding protein, partial [Xanthobacteraceae bacterium]|nr:AMP-binding protein [Xanthobacteraceae bacterium]
DLQRSQWLSAEEIVRVQKPLLERLVRHAAAQTDFYRERLAPLFGGADPASASIDLSRWSEVPVLRRQDAVDCLEQMKARSVPSDSGGARQGESSGSTGRPFPHLRSSLAVRMANSLLERVYELFDVDLGGTLAHITLDRKQTCRYPAGGKFKGWNSHSPEADLLVLDIGASARDQLEWLERVRADHVMTYPETLGEIAETAQAQGSPLRFRTFMSTGECLLPATAAKITQTFGCRIVDVYGAREIGPIAFQCPDAGGYHACAEALAVEFLDEEDRPVGPDEYGRVVVTSLYNYAMPFIRYDVGDYALASGESCPCGRGLPWVQEIAGRTRNMFVMPDGSRRRWRGFVMANMPRFLSYRQIQFVQATTDTIEVRYVPDSSAAPPKIAELTEFLRQEFHPDLDVRTVAVDRIERGAGMKTEQFISHVAT